MHLLTQSKHGISSLELARQLGVRQKTAWSLKHKLMQVMLERERTRVLSDRVETDDAYMGGQAHGKRGRGAGRKRPFLAAVQTEDGIKPHLLSLQGVCRAIQLKHLPRYLAEFQYRFNRRYDLSAILQRLLVASALTPPMPYRLLIAAEVGG